MVLFAGGGSPPSFMITTEAEAPSAWRVSSSSTSRRGRHFQSLYTGRRIHAFIRHPDAELHAHRLSRDVWQIHRPGKSGQTGTGIIFLVERYASQAGALSKTISCTNANTPGQWVVKKRSVAAISFERAGGRGR